ncbi:MAG: hypothetical protein KGQ66_22890 [Acidobacteriota bacterium]|nr:hypothetical protein [Acidobacteriota bacterium]
MRSLAAGGWGRRGGESSRVIRGGRLRRTGAVPPSADRLLLLAIRLHIVPALGDKKLSAVTAPDIQSLVNEWAGSRAARTVRRDYAVLRAMSTYAVDSD